MICFLFLIGLFQQLHTAYTQNLSLKAVWGDQGLSKSFVVFPENDLYENISQPFNLRYDFRPAAVAFPSTLQEISTIVKLGQTTNHQVLARSGGHSYIANGLGGKDGVIIIDLKNFQTITIDASSETAVIGSGTRLGDIVTGLAASGRALPHGTCPYIGIGGHSAHGGFEFASRMWGLTLDTILSIDVVLADGTIATASEKHNSDLFWALRGAASSFGITTSITAKTFSAPSLATNYAYNWHLTYLDAAVALSKFQAFALTSAPPNLGGEMVWTRGSVQGNLSVGLSGAWYGPPEQLNATLAQFLGAMPAPRTVSFDSGNYVNSALHSAGGSLNTSTPDGTDTFYAKSLMVPQNSPISDRAGKAFLSVLANEGFTTPTWFVQAELYGGHGSAINTVRAQDTAFSRRDSLFTMQFYSSAPGKVPPYPTSGFTFFDNAVDSIINNSPRNWDYGAYMNYVDDRLEDWQLRYFGDNYARLRRLKDIYDPRGTFSFPTAVQD
ncbi:glucooligosaccharide oxidase [Crassisporium funariophilum]|nr:glucooligosaccharide oxidase [Crassisporium funariophilum]